MMDGAAKLCRRIVIFGPKNSGKSNLAAILAYRFSLSLVELDGVFWKPDWIPTPRDEFRVPP